MIKNKLMKKMSNKPFILFHVGHSRAGATWVQNNLFNSKKAGFAMINRYTNEYKFVEAITSTSILKFDKTKIRSDLESVYTKFRKKKINTSVKYRSFTRQSKFWG